MKERVVVTHASFYPTIMTGDSKKDTPRII